MAQPAVSEHIRTLERQLGCKLLIRRGRGVELSEAGVRLHGWAKDILSRARELDRELYGLQAGTGGSVVVGASTTVGTYMLAEPLADFATARPGARVSLKASMMEAAIEDVRSGALDFGVVVAIRQSHTADISARALLNEPYVLVASPSLDLPSAIDAGALQDLRFACNLPETPRLELIDQPLRKLGLAPRNVVVELGHPEAIKRAVARGLGVAFLLRAAVERELATGELRAIDVDGVELSATIFLMHRADRQFSKLQSDLISAIEEALKQRAACLPTARAVID